MDSLPTGATEPWFIVAAVGLSPILAFLIADVVGWVRRRKLGSRAEVAPKSGREPVREGRAVAAPPG
jgi:hypothetical protein